MMPLLAIDTATPTVGVAIGEHGRTLAEVRLAGGRRHAEQLAPAIEYAAREAGVPIARLSAIACGVGPGLFTGLRVGITTAKTMAFALQVPVIGVSSLDLVAWPLRHTGRTIVAAIDARRGELFWAVYRPVPGGIVRDSGYEVGTSADLVADLVARDEEVLFAGDGIRVYESELRGYEHSELAGPTFDAPSVRSLMELACERFVREDFENPLELEPMYLRGADTTPPGPKAM